MSPKRTIFPRKPATILPPVADNPALFAFKSQQDMQKKCLALVRVYGRNWHRIGDELGISADRAARLCAQAASKDMLMFKADKDMYRHMEGATLDEMQSAIYEQALGQKPRVVNTLAGPMVVTEPDPQLMDQVLRIMKHRMDLYGLKTAEPKSDNAGVGSITINMIDACLNEKSVEVKVDGGPVIDATLAPFEPVLALAAPDEDSNNNDDFGDIPEGADLSAVDA